MKQQLLSETYRRLFKGRTSSNDKTLIESLSPETNQAMVNNLADKSSKLYGKLIKMEDDFDDFLVDDRVLDDAMERIVKKVGLTPEQEKIKGAYKFTYGDGIPEFKTLTVEQLKAILKFLEEVKKRVKNGGTFQLGDWDWDKDTFTKDEDED